MFSRLLLGISVSTLLTVAGALAQRSPVDLVNPLIGTGGEGQTFPATGVPFGMTQWTPQTREGETKCIAPYYVADNRIQGFRGSHFLSGSCTQDYGSVTLMPLLSDKKLADVARSSAFNRTSEVIHPYKYEVELADTGIHAEITGTTRSGMMRFRYPAKKPAWIVIENNALRGGGFVQIDVTRQEITGANPVHRLYAGNGKPAGFSGYFVIEFDRPFKVGGTWSGEKRSEGSTRQDASDGTPGAYVSFDLSADRIVTARIGTSFTSIDEARRNLRAEIPNWDFDGVANQSRESWNSLLNRIQAGGNSPDKTIFYTALYHSLLLPRVFSDRSGAYPRFAGGQSIEHADGFTYYDDFSVWDTFRALHPMLTFLDPDRELDMIKSLLAKGEQGGFLPIFPAWNSYTSEMVGDHVDAIIADAYVKGIRGFDAEAAYRLMRKNATEVPNHELYVDGRGRRSLTSYLKYGYIPLEDHVVDAFHGNEQVSRTLEYAYDDFLVGKMAGWLGHKADAKLFAKRGQNYRKVIDPVTGFARGRHEDGSWATPFDPAGKYTYITEGLPFQYTFFVPQDIPGLIEAVHGRQAFVKKLDDLFAGGYYNHGNEPSHHIAYLYNFAGHPEKTQLHVHQIMERDYHNSPDGLAGNDDAGQMSAWYVISALGFYAVTPGTPNYEIGTPHFDDVSLALPVGKTLHIVAKGAESGKFYIRSIRLNGELLHRHFLRHEEIIGGGELVFEMSSQPTNTAKE
ncbi:MAG: alpha-mannosidase [Acidobacteriales bacterium 59-55]|nr:MAG: alpha-mannosidase [Acidobacteriales bacterium 59-55]